MLSPILVLYLSLEIPLSFTTRVISLCMTWEQHVSLNFRFFSPAPFHYNLHNLQILILCFIYPTTCAVTHSSNIPGNIPGDIPSSKEVNLKHKKCKRETEVNSWRLDCMAWDKSTHLILDSGDGVRSWTMTSYADLQSTWWSLMALYPSFHQTPHDFKSMIL